MKKNKFIYSILAFAAIAFSSCGDKTTDTEKKGPTLTFKSTAGYTSTNKTVVPGDDVTFGIVANKGDEKITNVKVTVSYNGASALVVFDSTVNVDAFTKDITSSTQIVPGFETYTIIVTDKGGKQASQTIKITGEPELIIIESDPDSKIWNYIGPETGAFDFVSVSPMAVGDPDATKDAYDLTTTSTFSSSWGTKNNSQFIKNPSGTSYLQLTSFSQLATMWANNTSKIASSVTGLANGDLILVKSGQSGNPIIAVRITEVMVTPGDNNDYIAFDIKK